MLNILTSKEAEKADDVIEMSLCAVSHIDKGLATQPAPQMPEKHKLTWPLAGVASTDLVLSLPNL